MNKFNVFLDDHESKDQQWKNNGGITDQIESNNLQINVSNMGKEDRYLYDVYVSLVYAPTDRLLIEIKQKQTMSDFQGNDSSMQKVSSKTLND